MHAGRQADGAGEGGVGGRRRTEARSAAHLAEQRPRRVGPRVAAPAEGAASEGVALLVGLVVLAGHVDSVGGGVLASDVPAAGSGRCAQVEQEAEEAAALAALVPHAGRQAGRQSAARRRPLAGRAPIQAGPGEHSRGGGGGPRTGRRPSPAPPGSPGPAGEGHPLALPHCVEPEAAVVAQYLVALLFHNRPRPLAKVLPACGSGPGAGRMGWHWGNTGSASKVRGAADKSAGGGSKGGGSLAWRAG